MNNIPKIIHYCWFGKNAEPELMKVCIESWKRHLPDYELKLWNEDSFDINLNQFTKQAYSAKKWAFVSDYVRFYALYHYGGIYMDTDVEVIKNLDQFLAHSAFTGYENEVLIPTGIMGSVKNNSWVKDIMQYYEKTEFINTHGSLNVKPNTAIITIITTEKYGFNNKEGYQVLKSGLTVYPKDYFCPKSYYDGKTTITENTYTIHHFNGSWQTGYDKMKLIVHKIFILLFGKKLHDAIVRKKHSKA